MGFTNTCASVRGDRRDSRVFSLLANIGVLWRQPPLLWPKYAEAGLYHVYYCSVCNNWARFFIYNLFKSTYGKAVRPRGSMQNQLQLLNCRAKPLRISPALLESLMWFSYLLSQSKITAEEESRVIKLEHSLNRTIKNVL